MEKLDSEIKTYIDTVLPQADGSIALIREEDWTVQVKLADRIDLEKLQYLLASRNVDFAKKVYDMSVKKGFTAHPTVKKAVEKLLEALTVYEERYNKYVSGKSFDILLEYRKNKNKKTSDKKDTYIEDEIKFQSDLAGKMSSLQMKVTGINISGRDVTVVIPIHEDKPIPLVMRKNFEALYPEIIEVIKHKKDEADAKIKTIPGEADRSISEVSPGSEE